MGPGAAVFRKLELPSGVKGQVYLHSMPGRYETWGQFDAAAGDAHIQAIVCLAGSAEITRKSPSYAAALRSVLPYAFHHFPIEDYSAPDDDEAFAAFVTSTADRVRGGERVLVHCGAGVGRTGMFASCLLLALGCAPDEARATVAAAGSGPERPEQHGLVQRFAARRAT
jgi:Swiss Army Knife protein, DSP-PTPase phosphatase domain